MYLAGVWSRLPGRPIALATGEEVEKWRGLYAVSLSHFVSLCRAVSSLSSVPLLLYVEGVAFHRSIAHRARKESTLEYKPLFTEVRRNNKDKRELDRSSFLLRHPNEEELKSSVATGAKRVATNNMHALHGPPGGGGSLGTNSPSRTPETLKLETLPQNPES